MGEAAADAPADGDDSSANGTKNTIPGLIVVIPGGDIILEVTFETSSDVLRKARKAAAAAAGPRKPPARGPPVNRPTTQKLSYRVKLDALKKNSMYFANLLGNPQFREAQLITEAHEKLAAIGANAEEASIEGLPRISIFDDDEATKAAGREEAFLDMLRLIHGQPLGSQSKLTVPYVTTLVIFADRFDCAAAVTRGLPGEAKLKWNIQSVKSLKVEASRTIEAEQILRQKTLVAWLLSQPSRLHHSTRELVLRGSSLWSAFREEDASMTAAWWNLPDELEHELQFRRDCILNTIASVQRHFLALYSSKTQRQCKLGYDSSAACDSFQLGQMVKFLLSKNLLSLVDFGPASLDTIPDSSTMDIEELLTTLKQCPGYQVDNHHTNCGLRIRIDPILDFIRASLSANVISVNAVEWKQRREGASWARAKASKEEQGDGKFIFTRALANDQRLRYEGAMYADKMARKLFISDEWDWTPEY